MLLPYSKQSVKDVGKLSGSDIGTGGRYINI
jgi:hypothetical protein